MIDNGRALGGFEPGARTAAPNVVVVLVDDLGWADLGCYGSSFYETPHIDALARQGVRFTQAYAAAPVCSPTRASLMSGKYPARVGITNWIGGQAVGALSDVPYFHGLPQHEYSLARALLEGGYRTWHVGKWHLGGGSSAPQAHGFEVNIAGCERGSPASYFSPYAIPTLEDGPPGEYLTDRLTDEAVRLVREHDQRHPFLLNLWHYTVHTPIQAPEHLIRKYRDKAERLGLDPSPLEQGEPLPTWHQRGGHVQRRTVQSDAGYAAMVQTLDDSVGRLVQALRETGQLDDTVIVFTSDNGGLATAEGSPTCNAPLAEGKGWMQDGGVRVPLIVSWPTRFSSGAVNDLVCTTPDLYATLIAVTGAQPLPGQILDGVDLSPACRGQEQDRGPVYWHYPHYSNQGGTPGAAVRDGRYKLIRFFEDGRELLYDLERDIGEQDDLAASAPEIRDRLARLLDVWAVDVCARVPAPNPLVAVGPFPRGRPSGRTSDRGRDGVGSAPVRATAAYEAVRTW